MISEDVGGTIKILVVLHKNFEGGCLAADNSVKTISNCTQEGGTVTDYLLNKDEKAAHLPEKSSPHQVHL